MENQFRINTTVDIKYATKKTLIFHRIQKTKN